MAFSLQKNQGVWISFRTSTADAGTVGTASSLSAHFNVDPELNLPNNQIIVTASAGSSATETANKYVGKEVVYTNFGKNKLQIKGKITFAHGNSGCVRALFEKGLPGQCIGKKIEVKE